MEVLLVYIGLVPPSTVPLGLSSVAEADGVMGGLLAKEDAREVTLILGERRKEPGWLPEEEETLTLKRERKE